MNSTISEASLEFADQTVFPAIFEDMQTQFPPNEMYKFNHFVQLINNSQYKVLVYKRNSDQKIVGYSLVCCMNACHILWLDYIAILKPYQSQGYGTKLFEALFQKYCGPYNGMMFSVEHICNNNPKLAEKQEKRLKFYQKLGALQLKSDFILPCEDGGFPMYLYYKPHRSITTLSRKTQIAAITEMYDYCFFNLKHRGKLLQEFKNTISDEFFR